MDPGELLRACVPVFDRTMIGYFVTGSIATSVYGEPRMTRDIDLVVHLESGDAEIICDCFREPEFCVSPDAIRKAIALADQFNVIHPSSGLKLDFMVSALNEFDRSRFARTRPVELAPGLMVRLASPEDVILKKLEYFRSGGSDKHMRVCSACSGRRSTASTSCDGPSDWASWNSGGSRSRECGRSTGHE